MFQTQLQAETILVAGHTCAVNTQSVSFRTFLLLGAGGLEGRKQRETIKLTYIPLPTLMFYNCKCYFHTLCKLICTVSANGIKEKQVFFFRCCCLFVIANWYPLQPSFTDEVCSRYQRSGSPKDIPGWFYFFSIGYLWYIRHIIYLNLTFINYFYLTTLKNLLSGLEPMMLNDRTQSWSAKE